MGKWLPLKTSGNHCLPLVRSLTLHLYLRVPHPPLSSVHKPSILILEPSSLIWETSSILCPCLWASFCLSALVSEPPFYPHAYQRTSVLGCVLSAFIHDSPSALVIEEGKIYSPSPNVENNCLSLYKIC